MSMTEPRAAVEPRSLTDGTIAYVQWGPIFAGALAAAAVAFVLHSFAAAIGVSVSSTAPTWRDASFALVFLSGLYLILVALASYALGGYVAGRMRGRIAAGTPDEVDFRDGAHGLATWALATLLTALLAFSAAQALTRLSAPSSGAAGPGTSVAAENIIAYDLDRLLRSARPPQGDVEQLRAEAGRILLTAPGHRGVMPEDRAHLIRLVMGRTGLGEPEATQRVDNIIAQARENVSRARRSTVILAFMAGAAALLGAAAAWFAACAGGRHRDGAIAPAWLAGGRLV